MDSPENRSPHVNDEAARRHAMRTPLNHILGFTELLKEELEERTPEQIRADLQKIEEAARHLLGILDQQRDAQSAARPTPASQPLEPGAHRGGSILVVDDDLNNRVLMVRNLERNGYKVTQATDGEEALRHIESERFDLVLCDVVMPTVDGVEVLQRIRDAYGDHLPVVMISAVDQLQVAVKCLELGAMDYIQKPFEPAILLARVRATIERKRLRDREFQLVESPTGKGTLL